MTDVSYSFANCQPLLASEEMPEKYILQSIKRVAPDLVLYRTTAIFRDNYNSKSNLLVFRLQSPQLKMTFDFTVLSLLDIGVLMLKGPRTSGYKLKKFLIHQVAAVLFDVGFETVTGAVRRDGLIKLFTYFGFVRRGPNSSILQLSRESFDKVIKKKAGPLI